MLPLAVTRLSSCEAVPAGRSSASPLEKLVEAAASSVPLSSRLRGEGEGERATARVR